MGFLVPARRAQLAFAAQPQTRFTLTLDGTRYQFRFTWRVRTAAWYFDMWTQAGVAIVLGRRLSPSYGPLFGVLPPNAPTGYLFVRGPDPYEQDMLGAEFTVRYYTAAEVGDFDSSSGLIIT